MIDFRSDTVTKPSDEMRRAMAAAEVGDDVYGEDPTVRRLEEMGAQMLGTQDALFVCSGTMGNLLAVLTWCGRGTSALVGRGSHVYSFEAGGMAALGGVMPVVLDDSSGAPSEEEVLSSVPLRGNVHFAPGRLLCLEDTHNSRGGLALGPDRLRAPSGAARSLGLKVHLDGARLFNAALAVGCSPSDYGAVADSIMVCLSKGLGAPMGSLLCGPADFVREARHWRKRVGGGLRQAGVVAAAGIVALGQWGRLEEDHRKAQLLADMLEEGGLGVQRVPCPTNMVYLELPPHVRREEFVSNLARQGVLVSPSPDGRIRLVTHRDVSWDQVVQGARLVLKEAGFGS
ncbi:Threonine aldolase [Thermanaerovibrio acidaminovorans DSM 6589]|uniref:Threonine aldolase n=1 Tax=Thermanaerovibrio acidaminovorans (strain ATCC 49978 / DSM 6589 / Su883) TaxID=525903 RepID=D1B6W5_THEAS|nr:GntG family PLP-dependent aldolase [Thermanaerovibrio acidaminovorans]ACZ19756.1 Threonine aldolase [Thermanaerovibrio acidaminovorans DSM 6589]